MNSKCLLVAATCLILGVGVPGQALAHSKSANAAEATKSKKDPLQSMHGYISTTAPSDEIAGCIDEALSTAIKRSVQAQKTNTQVSKFNKATQKTWKAAKNTVNYMLDDRGFLPSMEGGDLMLDENIKVHDRSSAECAKQMWLDHTHDKVVGDIVEMVTGLGTQNPLKHQELITDAMQSLKGYDGDDTAQHIFSRLSNWSEREKVQPAGEAFPSEGMWTVKERQAKVDMIVGAVSKNDPIVEEVTKRVHKMSKHSKVAVATSQVVETTLNVASLTPTLVGPGAQAALLVFSLFTGGFEEDKLLSEMYLGKRYQSRETSFHNQAEMALDAYELATQTHNVPLASCSASLVKRLGGEDLWKGVSQNSSTLAMPNVATPLVSHAVNVVGPPASSSPLPGVGEASASAIAPAPPPAAAAAPPPSPEPVPLRAQPALKYQPVDLEPTSAPPAAAPFTGIIDKF